MGTGVPDWLCFLWGALDNYFKAWYSLFQCQRTFPRGFQKVEENELLLLSHFMYGKRG